MKRYALYVAAALAVLVAPLAAIAQSDSSQGGLAGAQGAHLSDAAQGRSATVHGKATNPLGQPIIDTNVFATTDGSPKSAVATFVTDANGDFSGKVPAGSYVFVLQDKHPKTAEKEIDDSGLVQVQEKQDVTVNFDGTRDAYIKKMSAEDRKALEETKAKNAAIMAENNQVKNLNQTLQQERDARKAKNYDQAMQLAAQITQAKPTEPIGWYELGMDQLGAKKYDDAIPSLQKAIQFNASSKKPSPVVEGMSQGGLGEAYAETRKIDPAVQAYDAAAKADTAGASMYYSNEAILLTQLGEVDKAAAAADKAIAADPTKPLPYYLKGQALVQKAGMDEKTQKVTVPPGCAEAYQKYLQLEPNGPHAEEVRGILQGIGVKVESKYKAK